MAQFRTFSTLRKSPGQSSPFTQLFVNFGIGMVRNCCDKNAYTHSVVSIEFFRKCDIMYYRSECEEGEKDGYRMYEKAA